MAQTNMPAASRTLPQAKEAQLKSYQKRLKDEIKSMSDNFYEIIKIGKIDSQEANDVNKVKQLQYQLTKCSFSNSRFALNFKQYQVSRASQSVQDLLTAEVRAASMVRSAESIMHLVSDIKQFLILNDFMQVNEAIKSHFQSCTNQQNRIDSDLMKLRDELAFDLYDLEEEYYSSQFK